jgi:hypothetical protein
MLFAGAVQAIAGEPFACVVFPATGTAWQTPHPFAVISAPALCSVGFTCAWCDPTPSTVPCAVYAFPFESTADALYAGAAAGSVLTAVAPLTPASTPWHAVHPLYGRSTPRTPAPSRCVIFAPAESPAVV